MIRTAVYTPTDAVHVADGLQRKIYKRPGSRFIGYYSMSLFTREKAPFEDAPLLPLGRVQDPAQVRYTGREQRTVGDDGLLEMLSNLRHSGRW
jgi:hypothetical protein